MIHDFKITKLLAFLVLLILVAGLLIVLPGYLEKKEVDFIKSLEKNHPEGRTFVEEILKARQELKDKDRGNDFSAYSRLGVYFNHLSQKERALENYQKALKIDPANFLVLNNTAEIYSDLSQYRLAEFYWLKILQAHPQQTMTYRSLGNLYRYRLNKTPSEIERFFQTGLEETDNSPDLLTWLVSYFQEIGDRERFVKYANLLQEASRQPAPLPGIELKVE